MKSLVLMAALVVGTQAGAQVPAALPQPEQLDMPVAPGTARRLLEATAGYLKDSYVFPDQVPGLEAKIRHWAQTHDYRSITTAVPLVEQLTKDLQELSHDHHLRVVFKGQAPSVAPDPAGEKAQDADSNFGFRRAEVLDGNLGYLDIRFFPYASEAGETAVAAMNFVSHTRALIIDLRQNHGGDPGTVALILSYLFGDEPVHLNDIYWRPDNSTGQYWTQGYVPGRKFTGDVYVLMGSDTFSAGEEFAYDLQALHRATLIGERTGGGAHPITIHPVDDHFAVLIPSGRAINPITHTDWEATGVHPDVAAPNDQALAKAQALALAKLNAPKATK